MTSTVQDRLQGVIGDFAYKAPCRVVATTPIATSGLQTIDGVALAVLDRVLVTGQTDTTLNGIYNVDTTAWELAPDFLSSQSVARGSQVFITDGTVNAHTVWYIVGTNPVNPQAPSNPSAIAVSKLAFAAAAGGTNGQIQYNNAGLLGGITAPSGDVTITVPGGVTTIAANAVTTTKILDANVTAAKLASSAAASNIGTLGGDLSGSTLPNPAIVAGGVTNAKLASVSTATFKGRTTAGSGSPEDLTATQATALLNTMVGDSGAGVTKGLVPAEATGNATTKFLRKDGTWAVPAGAASGTVNVVKDGSTTVTSPIQLIFAGAGATVSNTAGDATVTVSGGGRLLAIQRFATHQTVTPTYNASTTTIFIKLLGAGGGASGAAVPSSGQARIGAPGGAGAYLEKRLTSGFSGKVLIVGTGGVGGVAGDNVGSAGTATSFDAGGANYSAGGGNGGASQDQSLYGWQVTRFSTATATNGDLNVAPPSLMTNITLTQGTPTGYSIGGASAYGAPGVTAAIISVTSVNGGAAGGNGAGGAGGIAFNGSTTASGGAGTDGYAEIWEYS